MITKEYAVDNAARALTNYEESHRRTYGNTYSIATALAAAWTKLAKVIGEDDNNE